MLALFMEEEKEKVYVKWKRPLSCSTKKKYTRENVTAEVSRCVFLVTTKIRTSNIVSAWYYPRLL